MKVIGATEVRGPALLDDRSLKSALATRLPAAPRRIDRLTMQALLGAAPLQSHVQSNTGLYMAARYPARNNMLTLLDAVCRQQRQPKPFEFVNSVSNAAGFHVARALGLEGPNLFIGANPKSWRSLLELAHADLTQAGIDQALLILCDEDETAFTVQTLLVNNNEGGVATKGFDELSRDVAVIRQQIDA